MPHIYATLTHTHRHMYSLPQPLKVAPRRDATELAAVSDHRELPVWVSFLKEKSFRKKEKNKEFSW